MYQISNFIDNDDITTLASLGAFTVLEYQRDLSVMPQDAQIAYFANAMNVRKRQVVCDLSKANGGITLQAGAMQWTAGNVNATTGIKGMGDFLGKAMRGKVTGESAIKPEYTGNGTLVLEPTYRHILLIDLQDWNGSIVLDDGLFLACESTLKQRHPLPGIRLPAGGAGRDHAAGRHFKGGWKHGDRLERQPEFHGGALRKIADGLRCFRRGPGECIPRNR